MNSRNARLLQLLGIIIALVGVIGYWLTRDTVEKTEISPDIADLIGIEAGVDATPITFVVAGKDKHYLQGLSTREYNAAGKFIGWKYNGEATADGTNTDTIIHVTLVGNNATMVMVPRDLYLPDWQTKINSMYAYQGAEGLQQSVSDVLSLPADYYAIIDLDIFAGIVDALDGVDVYVPYDMYYHDNAADLTIDFKEGLTHLNGEKATEFARYRETQRGDIDRLDNVKMLANAMLARVKQLNVGVVTKLPDLLEALYDDVETNASPALVRQLIGRLNKLELVSATLPVELSTQDIQGDVVSVVRYDPVTVENFLAETFGGKAREFTTAPDAPLVISNRSDRPGLADVYKNRFVQMGIPADLITTRDDAFDAIPTRLLATLPHWQEADYYSSLLGVSKQQIDRLSIGAGVGLELVLGQDAASSYIGQTDLRASQAVIPSLPKP